MTATIDPTDTDLIEHQLDCEAAHGAAVEFAIIVASRVSDNVVDHGTADLADVAAVRQIADMIVGYDSPVGDAVWFDAMQSALVELRACLLNTQRRLGVDRPMRQWINQTVDMLLVEID